MPRDQVARSAGIIGLFTLGSRVLGLVRDAVVAAFYKKGGTDAFFVAFTIPNVLRRLLAEGALTVAFLPVFNDTRKKGGDDAARELLANTLGVLGIVLVLTSLAGMALSPSLVDLFAHGLDPQRSTLAATLTRLMFPFLITVGLVALAMGALNTYRHFAAPAAAPMLLNVVIITSVLLGGEWVQRYFGLPRIAALGCGVLAGGVAQLMLQLPALASHGLLVRPRFRLTHPGVLRIARLMAPSLFGLAIYQINIMLSRRFASYLAEGSISYLYYAQRLIEFPIGVFAVAVATASLPKLSEHASAGQLDALRETYRYSLRVVFFLLLPATAGLLALGEPLAAVLFQRGAFDHAMARETAVTLLGFAAGLVSAGGVRQTAPVFFALEDTRTPVVVSAVSLAVYIVAALSLYQRLATLGLALSVAAASTVNFGLLVVLLRRRLGSLGLIRIGGSVGRALLGSLLCGASAFGVARFGRWELGGGEALNYVVLVAAVGAGVAAYLATSVLLRSQEVREVAAALRRRRGRGAVSAGETPSEERSEDGR